MRDKHYPFRIPNITLCLMFGWLLFSSVNSVQAQTAVEKYGQLKVLGNKIVDKNGSPVQLRGMSFYWSMWKPAFYNYNAVKWLRDDWCVNVIRCPMGVDNGGYATNPTAEQNRMITMVDAAIQLGIYVIIDFHVGDGGNARLAQAKTFFAFMSQKYKDVPNIMYETWNEPGTNDTWAGAIKPYHEAVIATIRQNDPDNIIICGTRSWSQRVDEAAASPIAGTNIAYTLHYYAASHKQWLRDVAQGALNKGIALFVTEYGTCEASGNGTLDATETQAWWDFLEKNYIGCCNWSVADLGETSAALYTGTSANGNWPASALKPSGVLVRNYLKSKCNTTIPVNPTPTVSITAPANNSGVCAGASVTITATAAVSSGTVSKVEFYDGTTLLGSDNTSPYSYTWNNPSVAAHTIRAIATSAANVTSVPATSTLTVNALPVIDHFAQTDGATWNQVNAVSLCAGATLTMGPHPAVTAGWNWTGPNGYTAGVREITFSSMTAAQAGTYKATYKDANGCSNTASIVVTVNTSAAPTVTAQISYCQNTTPAALTASGSSLKWYTSATGGTASTTAPIPSTANTGTTNYYVSQTTNSCESSRAMIAVTINPLPGANITASGSTTVCQGGIVALSASAGSSYSWKNGTTTVGTNQTYNANSNGSYTVEVTNAAGCKKTSAPTTVTVNTPTTWYADTDNDGKGDPNVMQSACTKPTGYVSTAGDACPADASKTTPGNCGCGKTENSCLDCAGVPNGTAAMDACQVCSGGTTGITPVTNAANCTTTATQTSVIPGLEIYPNPYEQEITVRVNDGPFILTVYNAAGVEVLKGSYTTQALISQDLMPGMYLLRIEQGGRTDMRKVIKK